LSVILSQFEHVGRPFGLHSRNRMVESTSVQIGGSCRLLHVFATLSAICFVLVQTSCLPQKFAGPPSRLANRLRPKPVPAGPNGLYMDVIHLERPFADPELNNDLWLKADEEQLPIALRENLAAQGFRVAVLGGSLPAILKTLFNEEEIGQMNGEHLLLQQSVATQVQTGGIHAVWPKVANDDVKGSVKSPESVPEIPPSEADKTRNYVNAVGSLRVTTRITSDGCVDLVVLPEIQHGDARKMFVPGSGMNGPLDWSIQVGRQSRLFEELSFTLRLRSGQYALIGCYPLDRESLGCRFFIRQKDGQTMQRIVLIRVEASQEALAARSFQP
jgi:hypothetical protein